MQNKLPIVYQIYPKSFYDTNGDGIGDVQGIIEKLDYLQYLGIDMIWLTPIFTSPQRDNGYDVADYLAIDPVFGTMESVETLIQEAKKRDIGIMFDMVLNHTSTEHAWFKRALKDPQYQDFYFFREKPTNWESKFGGNAWEYVESLNLYYLHLFDVTQADLNWEHEPVFQALVDVVNFWLDKGIQGLRFDVINLVSKPNPDTFEDDFEGDGRRFYTDGPRIHEHLHRLNQETFGKYPNITTVGELSSTDVQNGVAYATPENKELSTIFNFHHLKVDYKDGKKWELMPFDFLQFKTLMKTWQDAMAANNANMSLFLNNHDQPRSVSRFGNDQEYPFESATALATAMQLMRGMPYIFQGEEIGLPNAYFDSIDDYRDVESINYYEILRTSMSDNEALEILRQRSRDNSRTPIPWDDTIHHGFTTGTPWLGLTKYPNVQTVADNLDNPNSVFHYYRKLIALRKTLRIIESGSITFEAMDHPELMIYTREYNGETMVVVINFYGNTVAYQPKQNVKEILLSNVGRTTLTATCELKPYEACVYAITA
ncbi:alpha,alpha-phosphotrehalase [Erysipelothrix sp. HDW6B]|uniref:alpha,alpha-phosphotrehalase n=1 Tax=Erysipelothrix sp. HDW6B TaxID=2714929 RepID=UPI00140E168F|nr:alpha,alpha-phosphotrehalase [Erysipelothrix sp. HDW6B]QIK85350.1 alpha,alpha-phosphotrehalase [Erysipelothrix sp. HDW6B]